VRCIGSTKFIRFEDVRDVGFFFFVAGWVVVCFANSGMITGSIMIILGVDKLMAGLLALKLERPAHEL